jgi:subtilisin family serine protease
MTGRAIALALWLCLAGAACAGAAPTPSAPGGETALGPRIMVMLRLGAEHYRAGNSYGGDYGDPMGQEARLRVARKIARDHRLTLVENWPMQIVGVDCVIMAVSDGRSAEAAAAEVAKERRVAWSQPVNAYEALGSSPANYNDRLSAAQPAVALWHLSSLHHFSTGRGQVIAIVDSRIDTTHPDFAGQTINIQNFVPGNLALAERHGTGVAGIIAARANNSLGIAGVAPDAHILGLRACWERTAGGATVCDTLTLAKAMTFALEHNADVVNLSLTGPPDRLLAALITIGIARGVTIVAAVDQSHPGKSFPSSVVGVIAVGDERLSPREPSVYIAPGKDIPTTEPEGKWSLVNGSSYATAHVSGLAALLRQLSRHAGAGLAAANAMGPVGVIDACAAVARVSALDPVDCRSRN